VPTRQGGARPLVPSGQGRAGHSAPNGIRLSEWKLRCLGVRQSEEVPQIRQNFELKYLPLKGTVNSFFWALKLVYVTLCLK
jgi:hypothetical protein